MFLKKKKKERFRIFSLSQPKHLIGQFKLLSIKRERVESNILFLWWKLAKKKKINKNKQCTHFQPYLLWMSKMTWDLTVIKRLGGSTYEMSPHHFLIYLTPFSHLPEVHLQSVLRLHRKNFWNSSMLRKIFYFNVRQLWIRGLQSYSVVNCCASSTISNKRSMQTKVYQPISYQV